MRTREAVLVAAVVLVGYSLYGVVFAVGANVAAAPAPELDPRPVAASADGSGPTMSFESVGERRGFEYEGVEAYSGTQAVMSNAGVYATDYDGDGWTDLLAVGGERPVLFENVRGEFRRSGALDGVERSVLSAAFLDHDGDGDRDLLLLSTDSEPLFLENTGGDFTRTDVGFDREFAVPVGAAVGDYDGDGCVDVFVAQNGDWTDRHPAGERNYSVPLGEDNGNPNYLYRGDCSTFQRVTDAGITGSAWSLATSMVDLDGDGRQDIHVANDFNHDVVYYNEGDGTFEKRRLGDRTNRNGMSSEVTDVNGDGRPDLFVTNIWFPEAVRDAAAATMGVRAEGNNLLVNRGNRTFSERAREYRVRRGGFAWASVAGDFDNDGDDDLFHATREMRFSTVDRAMTGNEERLIHEAFSFFSYPVLHERRGEGFVRLPAEPTGLVPTDGRGVAALDFDRDGDLDLAVAAASGAYRLYENDIETTAGSIELVVEGNGERVPLGARVHVTTGTREQVVPVTGGRDFLSQDARLLHFGAGNHTRADVRVVWPDGTERTFRNLATGHRYALSPNGTTRRWEFRASAGS